MYGDLEFPRRLHAGARVFDEHRIEVDADQRLDFLADDTAGPGVTAADFENALPAAQHLGDELVPGEHDAEPLRIGMPGRVRTQAETAQSLGVAKRHVRLILRFAGVIGHSQNPVRSAALQGCHRAVRQA